MKITTYSAEKPTHLFSEVKNIFKDFLSSGFIAKQIAKRDIQAMYRQSFLGLLWAFAPVITTSVVWIFLNSTGVVNQDLGMPKPLYIVIGTIVWSMFIECINSPIQSVNGSKNVISKINFPKEALLLSGIYKLLFNGILKMIAIVILLLVYTTLPSSTIVFFPIYLFLLMLLGTCLGVIIAPVGLLYTDIGRMIQLGATFLMYITPVVYLAPKSGSLKFLFDYNPLSPIITNIRSSLVGLPIDNHQILILYPICALILVLGLVFFRKSMPIIIEKIAG